MNVDLTHHRIFVALEAQGARARHIATTLISATAIQASRGAASDVIEAVFKANALTSSDHELSLSRTYALRTDISQCHECHVDFVSRWIEREGIHHFREHGDDKEKLVMTDEFNVRESAAEKHSVGRQRQRLTGTVALAIESLGQTADAARVRRPPSSPRRPTPPCDVRRPVATSRESVRTCSSPCMLDSAERPV